MSTATTEKPSTARHSAAWRPDIQGLRALAVALVVIAHVGTPGAEGGFIGVDVFFVISGFLITQLLLREVDRTGRVSIAQFYVRRARRILPAATVVTVAVVAYVLITSSRARLGQTAEDASWTSVFLANWHFAASGTNYFSVEDPSLFQHYWSLAVEEQFYLVWPILVLFVVPRFGKRGLALVSAGVFALSLGYSVWSTAAFPEPTYFNTAARAFELAAGALLACVMSSPLSSRWRHAAGLGGLAMLVYATLGFTEQTPFPGWHALVPVVGTALLLAAGPDTPAGRVASWAPVRYIGDISFSLYLWHWPVALTVPAAFPTLPPLLAGLLTVAISFVLALASYHLVEKTFQNWRLPGLRTLWFWPASVVIVICVALGASMLADVRAHAQQRAAQEYFEEHGYQPVEGSDIDEVQDTLDDAVQVAESGAPVPPDLDGDGIRKETWVDVVTRECYASTGDDDTKVCEFGDVDATQTIAVIGDSHAAMWMPALDILGRDHGFRVVPFLKMSCGAYPVVQDAHNLDQNDCDNFREFTSRELEKLSPDAIVIGSRGQFNMRDGVDGKSIDEQWAQAVNDQVTAMRDIAPSVVVLGDIPVRAEPEPKDCVDSPGASQDQCLVEPAGREQASNTITEEQAEAAGASYIDTMPFVCADEMCPLFAGDIAIYEDASHLNRLWVEHVAPAIGRELEEALE
ncbi:acyltransferase [Microbacterium nanhaiense]|uniref:Acyltransferase n=1 Tax=Microbacterium nanhaiense TaxID=1301026 RepID=A0ABQ2N327_9MICO|nr:acyltransferase family protein [Microbacterium nanhaiense]GGO64819.1 acyltransferase [Microbacterium nanhaiense]